MRRDGMINKNRQRFSEARDRLRSRVAPSRDVTEESQRPLDRLHESLRRFHNDLEWGSEYVHSDYIAKDPAGSWLGLSVETMADTRVRAALMSNNPNRCIIEVDDGRFMSFAAYKRWAIDHAASGAIAAESKEIGRGFTPVGRRTYNDGLECGETWATSLTVTTLLRFKDWCDELDPEEDWSAGDLWLAVYGKGGSDVDRHWRAIHRFWNIDPDAFGRLHRMPRPYLNGFRGAALKVAKRVKKNLPAGKKERL